jgi:asparagine synthase (glutamine-hydrolysing)
VGSLAVVYSRSSGAEPDATARMLGIAPHRGREHAVRVVGRVALGVSNDPDFRDAWLATADGRGAVFQGCLDNADELARALEREGAPPAAGDPASVVLAAFEAWGDDTPSRLRGSFSGAVSDGRSVRCFRDQLGFGTLFYRGDGRSFVAATEAKQVVAGAGIAHEPDPEAVEEIFWGRLGERGTALRGVERFPRASVGIVENGGGPVVRRYWDPSPLLETARLSVGEACERLTELLRQAVERTMRGSDAVPLSGGLDSTTIAAFAAPRHLQLSGRPLPAVSHVYPEFPSVDERPYIDLVANHLGLPLHAYVPTSRALDDLGYWVEVLDGPTNTLTIPSIVEANHHVRATGARTVLSGEFAEFAFTLSHHLIGHLILHGRWRAAGRWAKERRSRGRSWQRIARQAAPSVTPSFLAAWILRRRGRPHPLVAPWLVSRNPRRGDLAVPARRRWLDTQLSPIESPFISFEAVDLLAAHCGVHDRKPLADVDLWEFCLSLRAETKFPDDVPKSLIRRTMRDYLPRAIVERRDKTAFDEHMLGTADYEGLRRWILDSQHRIAGVDYALLRERIERRELPLFELIWAYDLARAHAFLSLWD